LGGAVEKKGGGVNERAVMSDELEGIFKKWKITQKKFQKTFDN